MEASTAANISDSVDVNSIDSGGDSARKPAIDEDVEGFTSLGSSTDEEEKASTFTPDIDGVEEDLAGLRGFLPYVTGCCEAALRGLYDNLDPPPNEEG